MDSQTIQAARLWTVAQPIVSAFVTSAVRDFAARDDVLQEVAVAVLQSFDRYDPQRPFVAWALGIAQNQVRLYLRRLHRDRFVFDDDVLLQIAAAFETTPAEESQALGFLRGCLEQLEGRARQICELRYGRDLKPAAIAETLGMASNTVAKALQRIRDQLRACIERRASVEGGL